MVQPQIRGRAPSTTLQAAEHGNGSPQPPVVHPFDPVPAVVLSHDLLDTLMPACDPYEWKIICAVLRHQGEKKLSVGKFMRWTGLHHRKTCFDSLTRCLEKGYIVRIPAGNSYAYRPNYDLKLPAPDPNARPR